MKAAPAELKVLHNLIRKVSYDIEHFSMNTSVSAFMIAVNELSELKCRSREIRMTAGREFYVDSLKVE